MLGIMMFSMRLYACFCAAFIVVPVPTTISTTPDVPVTTHSLLICLTSSIWTPSRVGFLKMMTASLDVLANVSGSVYGNGGGQIPPPTRQPRRAFHTAWGAPAG